MTKKEIQLEMLKQLHNSIKLNMSPDIDIMEFYAYDEDTKEYRTCYKGQGIPTSCDFTLANIFMYMKHSFEYHNDLTQSLDMSLTGE